MGGRHYYDGGARKVKFLVQAHDLGSVYSKPLIESISSFNGKATLRKPKDCSYDHV